jgi:superfamily II DNA/RNA helicase
MPVAKLTCHTFRLAATSTLGQATHNMSAAVLFSLAGKSNLRLWCAAKFLRRRAPCAGAVLIFSQFTRMLDILEDYLTLAQYPTERIDGSVGLRERQAAIDRYSKGALRYLKGACQAL